MGSESLSGASGFSISRLGSSSKRVGEEPRDDRPLLGEGGVDEEERSLVDNDSFDWGLRWEQELSLPAETDLHWGVDGIGGGGHLGLDGVEGAAEVVEERL